jgi:hypothetical protein
MRAFPLLLLAVILYNLIVFGGGLAGRPDVGGILKQAFGVTMPSGDIWNLTYSDLFIAFTLILLFVEMVKATRTGRNEILNHAFSTLVFVGTLIEFLLLKGFATSAFGLLTAMSLFDVVAGYTISIISARRDLTLPERD